MKTIPAFSTGVQKSETIDEGLFIAGGAAQVRHLNPNIAFSHPPLLRWLSGLSATFLGGARTPEPAPFISPDRSVELYSSKLSDEFSPGTKFFYDAGNDHDRVLFWGHFPFVFFGAVLGWLIFTQVRHHSRSYLSGWWPPGDPYAWLRELHPVTLVGNSIALFNVDEQALSKIGQLTKKGEEEKMMKAAARKRLQKEL